MIWTCCGVKYATTEDFASHRKNAHPPLEEIGPTGKFPNGKISKSDEGELAFRIAADPQKNVVVIDFGSTVSWLGMPKHTALALAEAIRTAAERL